MNIHGASRAGRRRRKACRLWTGGGPQRAYSGRGGGILCRHAHSLFYDTRCTYSYNYKVVNFCPSLSNIISFIETNKRHPIMWRKIITNQIKPNSIYVAQSQWSKKEAGFLPQSKVECPSSEFFIFIFDLKMVSFDALLVVFCAI